MTQNDEAKVAASGVNSASAQGQVARAEQGKKNLRLALILFSVALVLGGGFVAKVAIFGG